MFVGDLDRMAYTLYSRFHPPPPRLQPWRPLGFRVPHSAYSAGERRTVFDTCCDLGWMRRTDVATVRSGKFERRADVCCGSTEKLLYFRELNSYNPAGCVLANVMTAVVVGIARSPSFLEIDSARSGEFAIPKLGVSSLRRIAGAGLEISG